MNTYIFSQTAAWTKPTLFRVFRGSHAKLLIFRANLKFYICCFCGRAFILFLTSISPSTYNRAFWACITMLSTLFSIWIDFSARNLKMVGSNFIAKSLLLLLKKEFSVVVVPSFSFHVLRADLANILKYLSTDLCSDVFYGRLQLKEAHMRLRWHVLLVLLDNYYWAPIYTGRWPAFLRL